MGSSSAILSLHVTYSLNGGSGTTPASVTRNLSYQGSSVITMPAAPTPPTGQHFLYWRIPSSSYYTRSNGTPGANVAVTFTSKSSTTRTVTCAVSAQYAWNTYTVSYNANGGSGAPANQTKTYGTNLTLSSTRPVREGYTFLGWATSSSGAVVYQPGGTYSANAAATLYAKWQINTWSVSYNANGGSGAPPSQTKTYGQTLLLSSVVPTKYAYKFMGWATSTGGTAVYQPGDSYTNNAGVTLYAVWEQSYFAPTITNLSAIRAKVEGGSYVDDEETGTYAHVIFNWATGTDDGTAVRPASCTIRITNQSTDTYTDTVVSLTDGLVDTIITNPVLNESIAYTITVTFTVTGWDDVVATTSISTSYFIMDINPDGTAIGFGGVVEDADNGVIVFIPLLMYIDDSAITGTSDEIIKTALIDLGWDSDCLE